VAATPASQPKHNTRRSTKSNRGILYPTLAELVKRSHFVVVGVQVELPDLKARNSASTKQFAIRVQEVLKGQLRNGLVIRVNVPGNTSGSGFVPAPGEAALVRDQSQVLFLIVHRAGRNTTYEVVGGREGVFPLDTRNGVVHLGGRWGEDPLVQDYARNPQQWLLNDVRTLAKAK
jgi:hypothetical protein